MTRNIDKTNRLGMPDALIVSENEYNVIVTSAFHKFPHGIQGAELCLAHPSPDPSRIFFYHRIQEFFLNFTTKTQMLIE